MDQRKLFSRLLFLCAACALISCPAPAQFGKPYQQWTAKEAKELLVNSPWAQTHTGLVWVDRFATPTPAADSTVTVRDRDKAAIDAQNRALLECPACINYYMVTIGPGPASRNVPQFPRTMSFAVGETQYRDQERKRGNA